MRKFTLFLITAFLAFGYNGWGQSTIKYQSFESGSDDWAYTPSPTTYSVGSDVWAVVTSSFHTFNTIPSESTHFWGMEDLANGNGGTATGVWSTLTFASVDVSAYTSVSISFDYEVDGYDTGDDIKYQAFFDSSGEAEVLLVDGYDNLNQDGTVTISVSEGTNAIYLIVSIKQNGSDFGGFDNFKVIGTAAGGVNNPTSFAAATTSVSQIDLSWVKNGNGNDVLVAWSSDETFGTPSGSYSAGNPISGGGTVLYNGSNISYSHTSLTSNNQYYYKAWSVDGSTTYSSGATDNATTYKVVPTNHVSSFAVGTPGAFSIPLSWTANDGAVVPDGYLIKASTSDNVSAPVDGTAVADNTTIGSNSGAINITHGTNAYEWAGLTAETEYHFKIYPYTNSGSNINFKTSATVPSVNATTEEAIAPSAGIVFISEVCDAVTDYNSEFLELYNNSNNIISLSNTKIIRYPGVGGESEYVWDFSTDGSGDTQIPANGIILITRGATKAEFVSEWGSIPSGVNYNEGNSLLYFGGGRRWAIKDGGTANTDDGTEIDATNQAVANGNGDYQYPTGTWNAETEGNATPGVVSSTQDPAAYLWDGGAATTNWNDADNWNPNQLPGSGTNVTIEAGKVSIEIASDQTADCYDLKVDGTLTIKSDASNTGSLIVNGTLSGSGTTTMERTIDEYTNNANGWHLLSSPINNLTISGSDFEPGTGTPNLDDFYGWDELTFFWLNQKVVANNITNFVNGVGYLVSYETLATKDFTGTFNNADVTFTNLSKTTNKGEGWHLLGNPFQSALQWTNTDWVRTNFGVGAKIMNPGGSYTDITVGGTDIIPANQGFFVEATVDNSNTITIPESQRVHSITPFYKNSVPNMLSLKAVDGDFYQKSCIQFMDGSSNNYDEDYDVHFLGGMSGTPQFYSFIEEDNLSTNRIPTPENETIVPMIFSTSGETTVSIEAEGVESFAPSFEILLEDLQENIIIDLLENPIYTFESNPEYDAERFRVHFKSTTGISEGENISSFNIYSFNKNIYVSNPEFQNANVFVYNLIGQEVATFKINGDATNSFQLGVPSGYYLVKVVGDQTINTKKVYLK